MARRLAMDEEGNVKGVGHAAECVQGGAWSRRWLFLTASCTAQSGAADSVSFGQSKPVRS